MAISYRFDIDPDGFGDGLRQLCETFATAESDVKAMRSARRRIKAIADPTERERVGSTVFGRAWVEVVYGDS